LETASGGWYLELEGRRVDLLEGEHTLGRSRGCGVVLRDPSVSRGHALLSMRDGAITLQDLQSSNGTYVNGRRLEAEVRLVAGDRLILGETELFLRRSETAGSGNGAPPAAEPGLFCPSCGVPLPASAESCPACGSSLAGARVPRRSEAIALGEVLPVGEVLGASSGSWDETRFRRNLADRPSGAVTTPTPLPQLTPASSTEELRVPPLSAPLPPLQPLPPLPPGAPPPASFRQRLARAWQVLLGRD
jgi:predicted component of type VI protein secretion system